MAFARFRNADDFDFIDLFFLLKRNGVGCNHLSIGAFFDAFDGWEPEKQCMVHAAKDFSAPSFFNASDAPTNVRPYR
jgi:hypothetical protein